VPGYSPRRLVDQAAVVSARPGVDDSVRRHLERKIPDGNDGHIHWLAGRCCNNLRPGQQSGVDRGRFDATIEVTGDRQATQRAEVQRPDC
jgi:hypothetical protein